MEKVRAERHRVSVTRVGGSLHVFSTGIIRSILGASLRLQLEDRTITNYQQGSCYDLSEGKRHIGLASTI